ncbi:hypothetical protein FS815_25710 [Agrobacterium vitis]|uniref:hypothetical protein n=1 Tax=Allorhizobium ampelinum TaxID=3025782 RepID=UPI001F3176E2|nr:hypothetical protein [Allorhizobium ampelinum]MCF1450188.1 hypothetical protein [Allorhizobium ampelinum]
MLDRVKGKMPDNGGRRDAEQMRQEIQKVIATANASGNYFLIYLLGMALQEIDNIEHGTPTPFTL